MPALAAGKDAPLFSLPLLNGGDFDLEKARQRGPVLLAFFKISCPICQFTLPYVERLHKSFAGERATIVGISQDDASGTARFAKEYGLTLPLALEDTNTYEISNQYGLTNVPTLFLIARSGRIEASVVGWSRADMEHIARELAFRTGITHSPLIGPNESAPDYKAG